MKLYIKKFKFYLSSADLCSLPNRRSDDALRIPIKIDCNLIAVMKVLTITISHRNHNGFIPRVAD